MPGELKKIYIIGSVAGGKTTFARQLSQEMGLPWFQLDSVVHKHTGGGRVKQSPEAQMAEIRGIDESGGWIFEGVYRKSYHCTLDLADTIIFLDTPLPTRIYRIITRHIKQKLGLEACLYKPSLHMLRMMFKWTFDFERNRTGFVTMLAEYSAKVVVISKPSELNHKSGSALKG